jgi:multidrug efflux pump subunit AcrA (membrane-fusion protein)
VKVTLDAFPNEEFTGTIVRNSDAIDLNTRTLNVEVDVDNRTGRLFPGAYAFVHLKVPASVGSVTIPSNALLFRSEGLRADVVRNGHVVLIPITIGQDYGSAVEVLSGLTPNDAVIENPSDSLAEGAAVRIGTKTAGMVRR